MRIWSLQWVYKLQRKQQNLCLSDEELEELEELEPIKTNKHKLALIKELEQAYKEELAQRTIIGRIDNALLILQSIHKEMCIELEASIKESLLPKIAEVVDKDIEREIGEKLLIFLVEESNIKQEKYQRIKSKSIEIINKSILQWFSREIDVDADSTNRFELKIYQLMEAVTEKILREKILPRINKDIAEIDERIKTKTKRRTEDKILLIHFDYNKISKVMDAYYEYLNNGLNNEMLELIEEEIKKQLLSIIQKKIDEMKKSQKFLHKLKIIKEEKKK